MPKVLITGTHQHVTAAGAAWIERKKMDFRCIHHRDPEGRELIALVMEWRELEADTSARKGVRREHKAVYAVGNYSWQAKTAPCRQGKSK